MLASEPVETLIEALSAGTSLFHHEVVAHFSGNARAVLARQNANLFEGLSSAQPTLNPFPVFQRKPFIQSSFLLRCVACSPCPVAHCVAVVHPRTDGTKRWMVLYTFFTYNSLNAIWGPCRGPRSTSQLTASAYLLLLSTCFPLLLGSIILEPVNATPPFVALFAAYLCQQGCDDSCILQRWNVLS